MFDDTKGVTISRESEDRQYNGQKGKKNDLQTTTQKTKHWATRTSLKIGVISCALEG